MKNFYRDRFLAIKPSFLLLITKENMFVSIFNHAVNIAICVLDNICNEEIE